MREGKKMQGEGGGGGEAGGMPLYAASLWDSFTTRRFKTPFKTVVGLAGIVPG